MGGVRLHGMEWQWAVVLGPTGDDLWFPVKMGGRLHQGGMIGWAGVPDPLSSLIDKHNWE